MSKETREREREGAQTSLFFCVCVCIRVVGRRFDFGWPVGWSDGRLFVCLLARLWSVCFFVCMLACVVYSIVSFACLSEAEWTL